MADETTDSGAGERCCPGHGSMAHVLGCVNHPEFRPAATPDVDDAHEWPACATYPNLGCVCRGALGQNTTTCTRKRTGDLTPIPAVSAETTDASRRDGSEPEGSGDHSGAGERADHPGADPGDGRTQCATCGKWVWLVTHSCKGVRVYPATPDADDASEVACQVCAEERDEWVQISRGMRDDADDASERCASSHDGHPCGVCDASTGASEGLTLDEREALGWGVDYGTAIAEVERIVAAAATRARAEVGKPMTSAEQNVIAKAFERDRWAGEWNSLPTAIDNLLRNRAARIARGDA